MSRKSDDLIRGLAIGSVAEWLKHELIELPMNRTEDRACISRLLLKLGYDVGRDETTQPDRVTTEVTG